MTHYRILLHDGHAHIFADDVKHYGEFTEFFDEGGDLVAVMTTSNIVGWLVIAPEDAKSSVVH